MTRVSVPEMVASRPCGNASVASRIVVPEGSAQPLGHLGGVLLAAAWGLWADRMWARPLVVGCGAVIVLVHLVPGAMTGGLASLLSWIVGVALAWAYLYDSRGVVAYYAWLEEVEASGSG
ncbi:MAG: hypothetical protein EA350_08360 [Gemmatimonadales bacterium]|nr:MAG: hypothetical protein EA350_08360 [Gemmatimonadales bacterium]